MLSKYMRQIYEAKRRTLMSSLAVKSVMKTHVSCINHPAHLRMIYMCFTRVITSRAIAPNTRALKVRYVTLTRTIVTFPHDALEF